MSNAVYQVITDKLIELLEQGVIPWRRPWAAGPASVSYRGYPYRGINTMMLSAMASFYGLRGAWITYKQATKLGGKVKKGAKSVPVIYWKWIEPKAGSGANSGTGSSPILASNGRKGKSKIPLCRYYRVFSICQVEGLEDPSWLSKGREEAEEAIEPIEQAERIWEAYPERPELAHGGDAAYYAPMLDKICMPDRVLFESAELYYLTLFHEMTHSTGHHARLKRFDDQDVAAFGSESYSKEELVAEIGAAFLAAEAGLQAQGLLEHSASYLSSWIRVLKEQPRMVVMAGAQAQRACDLVLNRTFDGGGSE